MVEYLSVPSLGVTYLRLRRLNLVGHSAPPTQWGQLPHAAVPGEVPDKQMTSARSTGPHDPRSIPPTTSASVIVARSQPAPAFPWAEGEARTRRRYASKSRATVGADHGVPYHHMNDCCNRKNVPSHCLRLNRH